MIADESITVLLGIHDGSMAPLNDGLLFLFD